MKGQALHTVWCDISGKGAGEVQNWSLLAGVKAWVGQPTDAELVLYKSLTFRHHCYFIETSAGIRNALEQSQSFIAEHVNFSELFTALSCVRAILLWRYDRVAIQLKQ